MSAHGLRDANFKNALLNHDPVIDTNDDGEISVAEAQGRRNMNSCLIKIFQT